MRTFLFLLVFGCGGSSRIIEIPPLDEDESERVRNPNVVAPQEVEREDLGVLSMVQLPNTTSQVQIRLLFDVGSVEDPPGKSGLTFLTAELIADRSNSNLGNETTLVHADTQRDKTVFEMTVEKERLNESYAAFRDGFLHPHFDENRLQRLKSHFEVDRLEVLSGVDPENLSHEILLAMMYENHPYGCSARGTSHGFESITLDDVRHHAQSMFCAGRMIVGIGGEYPEDFPEQLRNDFSQRNSEECVGRMVVSAPSSNVHKRVWLVNAPHSEYVGISLGIPFSSNPHHLEHVAFTMSSNLLGSLKTKMEELHYSPEYFEPRLIGYQSYFFINFYTLPQDAHFFLRGLVRQLHLWVERGVSEEVFENAKNALRQELTNMEQLESDAVAFHTDHRFYDTIEPWPDNILNPLPELSVSDLNQTFRRHLDLSRLQIAVVAQMQKNLRIVWHPTWNHLFLVWSLPMSRLARRTKKSSGTLLRFPMHKYVFFLLMNYSEGVKQTATNRKWLAFSCVLILNSEYAFANPEPPSKL